MKPAHRSLAGAAIAVLALPAFLGLMACLPVPVGDPEKSRIDPELTGVWLHSYGEDDEIAVSLLEPYDKRTWLVHMYGLEATVGEDCAEPDSDTLTIYEYWLEVLAAGEHCAAYAGQATYKVWRAEIARTWLMTWEPMGGLNDADRFGTDFWYVFRIDKQGKDHFDLPLINFEYDPLEEVFESDKLAWLDEEEPPYDPRKLRSARKAVERVIRRHIGDEELFSDEALWRFDRIPPERYETFFAPLDDALTDFE